MSRRTSQIATALLGAVPVITGVVGLPLLPFVGFTALEIIGAPLFIWWHSRVLRQSSQGANW